MPQVWILALASFVEISLHCILSISVFSVCKPVVAHGSTSAHQVGNIWKTKRILVIVYLLHKYIIFVICR